jgi:hypothetical protein
MLGTFLRTLSTLHGNRSRLANTPTQFLDAVRILFQNLYFVHESKCFIIYFNVIFCLIWPLGPIWCAIDEIIYHVPGGRFRTKRLSVCMKRFRVVLSDIETKLHVQSKVSLGCLSSVYTSLINV